MDISITLPQLLSDEDAVLHLLRLPLPISLITDLPDFSLLFKDHSLYAIVQSLEFNVYSS